MTLSRVKQQQQQNTKHIIENSYNLINRNCNRISVYQSVLVTDHINLSFYSEISHKTKSYVINYLRDFMNKIYFIILSDTNLFKNLAYKARDYHGSRPKPVTSARAGLSQQPSQEQAQARHLHRTRPEPGTSMGASQSQKPPPEQT